MLLSIIMNIAAPMHIDIHSTHGSIMMYISHDLIV